MRLTKVRVEKSEFAAFQRFQDDVNRAYRVWMNLRPSAEIADAPVLEKFLAEQKFKDAATVKVLARLYLDHDRLEDARKVLAKANPLFPDDTAIWDLRVQASENVEAEERLYRAMVKQFPQEAKYVVALGAVCVRRDEHQEARKILTPLADHASAAVRGAAHYQLARNAYRAKQPEEAMKHLQAVLFVDPSGLATLEAMQFKARVQEKLGQLKDAILTLQVALDSDATARDVLEALVRLEMRAGRHEEALDHLRRYTVAAGKDLSSLVKAADLYYELGHYDAALELAGRAREVGFQAKGQRILGLVHLQRHEYKQAAFHLDRCDLDAKALTGLIQAHLRLGELDAAQRRAEMTRRMEDAGKDLFALEKDVTQLAQRRDKLLAQWKDAPKEERAAAKNVVSRFLCAERGLAEHWRREQLDVLVKEADSEDLEFAPLRRAAWLVGVGEGPIAPGACRRASGAQAATRRSAGPPGAWPRSSGARQRAGGAERFAPGDGTQSAARPRRPALARRGAARRGPHQGSSRDATAGAAAAAG